MIFQTRIVTTILEGIWIAWALYWFINAFGNKRTIYKEFWLQRFTYFLVSYIALRLLLFKTTRHVHLFQETIFTQTTGIALCVAGITLSIWARQTLGSNWSGLITLKENHELIRGGPYRFVRHPIYSAIILAAIGTILATNPYPSGIIFLAFLIILFKLKSLSEEKILMQHFPESYPQYKQDVKSLIPFVC